MILSLKKRSLRSREKIKDAAAGNETETEKSRKSKRSAEIGRKCRNQYKIPESVEYTEIGRKFRNR